MFENKVKFVCFANWEKLFSLVDGETQTGSRYHHWRAHSMKRVSEGEKREENREKTELSLHP